MTVAGLPFSTRQIGEDVRNPPGNTQCRLGIQDSVTYGPTRIALLNVCFRVLLRFVNSLLNLGDAIVL